MRRLAALVAALGTLLASCGEPPVDLEIPPREPGQVLLDRAGILAGSEVEQQLRSLATGGSDVVALTYETERASAGEAQRAGRALIAAWGADIVLVAVAQPGAFAGDGPGERFFGIEPADHYAVPRGLREHVVERLVPPVAARNDWPEVFATALAALGEELKREQAAGRPGGPESHIRGRRHQPHEVLT